MQCDYCSVTAQLIAPQPASTVGRPTASPTVISGSCTRGTTGVLKNERKGLAIAGRQWWWCKLFLGSTGQNVGVSLAVRGQDREVSANKNSMASLVDDESCD